MLLIACGCWAVGEWAWNTVGSALRPERVEPALAALEVFLHAEVDELDRPALRQPTRVNARRPGDHDRAMREASADLVEHEIARLRSLGGHAVLFHPAEIALLVPVLHPILRVVAGVEVFDQPSGRIDLDQQRRAVGAGALHAPHVVIWRTQPGARLGHRGGALLDLRPQLDAPARDMAGVRHIILSGTGMYGWPPKFGRLPNLPDWLTEFVPLPAFVSVMFVPASASRSVVASWKVFAAALQTK